MKSIVKRLTLIFLMCLSILHIYSGSALALEEYRFTHMSPPLLPVPLQVTSPYGPRTLNGHDFHAGIDFAADYGQEVHSVADGVVDSAFNSGNDGGIVIIYHEKGWYSVYVDLQTYFPVSVGETVSAGDVIGLVGKPPGATGPHLHFTIRVIDPGSKGVLPWLYAPYAPWLPQDCVSDALASQSKFTFDATYDFTGKIKETIDKITEACTKAMDFLKGIIAYTIVILMTIDICIAFLFASLPGKNGGAGTQSIFKLFTAKVLLYGFLFFAITNWTGFLANGVRDFFIAMGATPTASEIDAAKTVVADPFSIVARGAKIVEPIFLCLQDAESGFRLDFLSAIAESLAAGFFFLIIFGCFILIAIQISIAYIQFYLCIVFGYATFMFSGLSYTRRFASNGLSGIFTSAVKLLIITFYACLMTSLVNTMTIGNIVTEEDNTVGTITAHTDGNFKDVHEFAQAIKIVETGGSPESYLIPSCDGWGYGAYQISYENWDSWCSDAGVTEIPPMPWPEGSSAWYTSYGDRSLPYDGDWHVDLPPAPTPWPPSIQDKVALHKMQKYYDEFQSWQKVAYAWNGGPGRANSPIPAVEQYWEKVCNASGLIKKRMHTLNFAAIILLTMYCIFFVLIGDRVISTVTKLFGKGGWVFTSGDK